VIILKLPKDRMQASQNKGRSSDVRHPHRKKCRDQYYKQQKLLKGFSRRAKGKLSKALIQAVAFGCDAQHKTAKE